MSEFEDSSTASWAWTRPDRSPTASPGCSPPKQIADQQGFFHWELTFAQAFAKGGFDLQVGNPPWVRPDWDETTVSWLS